MPVRIYSKYQRLCQKGLRCVKLRIRGVLSAGAVALRAVVWSFTHQSLTCSSIGFECYA